MYPFGSGWCYQPGRPEHYRAAVRGKFSPTSLAEEEPEWFISAAARTTSSSSQIQAFGPTLLLIGCGLTGPYAGLDPGPILGYKSYPGRTGPVAGIFFLFLKEKDL